MSDLVICELCGTTFSTISCVEICPSCMSNKATEKRHQKTLDNAKKQRQIAKFIGLKALKGTAKQKSWAETIRKELIEKISKIDSKETHKVFAILSAGVFMTADFWINRRNIIDQVQSDLYKAVELKDKANAMHAAGESGSAEYNEIASQYHAVIEKFN